MSRYAVQGYRRIAVMMQVEADSEAEAIQLAKEGLYDRVDTEPDGDLNKPIWTAHEVKPNDTNPGGA